MPTGYTQQIIDGTVKTPKEFLHLCLRNFGVCISMRDMPLDSQGDYTESIKKYYQERTDKAKKQNAQYQSFYDVIKNWDCSEEFSNIKKFALDQIDISKEAEDYYTDELSKEMLTKEEFISNSKSKYEEDLLNQTKWDIDYHQEQLDDITKRMSNVLAFYERFKKEIEKL